MPLTASQIRAIDITEKTSSILSVLGAIFVIVTFLLSSKFRKPINRLVFYATWGNLFANVATLIGMSAVGRGGSLSLCQFQAFMIQWFMAADAIWTFAMACNVYLSFFHHYDGPKLRSLELKYLALCYGVPFLPAFSYLFVSTPNRGKIYGDAVLWCWVSIDWDFLRVATFYAPTWIVIILTLAIYLRVGFVILSWRRELLSLGKHSELGLRESIEPDTNALNEIRRTDEVTITTVSTIEECNLGGSTHIVSQQTRPTQPTGRKLSWLPRRLSTRQSEGTYQAASTHANKATVKYYKCALLFFIALLCTWVPSTINRIYTLVHPKDMVFGLQYAASLVLPLQGFWNAVIYTATSVFACKCLWQEIRVKFANIRSRIARRSRPVSQDRDQDQDLSPHRLSRVRTASDDLSLKYETVHRGPKEESPY